MKHIRYRFVFAPISEMGIKTKWFNNRRKATRYYREKYLELQDDIFFMEVEKRVNGKQTARYESKTSKSARWERIWR